MSQSEQRKSAWKHNEKRRARKRDFTGIQHKIVDVQYSQGSAITEEAIQRIAKLYGIEKEVPGRCLADRVILRRKKPN